MTEIEGLREEIERLNKLIEGKQYEHPNRHPDWPLICFHCGKRVPAAFNQCGECKEAVEAEAAALRERLKKHENNA